MINQIIMIGSRCDGDDIGVNGRVVVRVAAVVLPFQLAVLRPLKHFNVAVRIRRRMVDVEADPSPQQRRTKAELEFPSCKKKNQADVGHLLTS